MMMVLLVGVFLSRRTEEIVRPPPSSRAIVARWRTRNNYLAGNCRRRGVHLILRDIMTSADGMNRANRVGQLLQDWRRTRGKSQLALSLDSGVSTRHLSFIESGRANPSRDMVLLLADALDVPLRERNDLLTAAGYAEMYRENGLSQPALAQARQAIDLILERQKPFPAVVMDRHWTIVTTNRPAEQLFARLLAGRSLPGPPNVIRLMFHPEGVRRCVTNWEAVAGSLLRRMHREAIGGRLDDGLRALFNEALALAGMPARLLLAGKTTPDEAVLPVQFRHAGLALDFFSTLTTLGTPRDVTLQEIRIECFHPANEETDRRAREFFAAAVVGSTS
jgi:transcriptional regulator with XRE-family HTH domain